MLAQSDVVSLHLLLTDETKGLLSRERIAAMKHSRQALGYLAIAYVAGFGLRQIRRRAIGVSAAHHLTKLAPWPAQLSIKKTRAISRYHVAAAS